MYKHNLFIRFILWILGIPATKKVEQVHIDLDEGIERYEEFGKSQNR